jgi:uncharacterized protein DUF4157
MPRDPRWYSSPESSHREDAHRSRRCHRARPGRPIPAAMGTAGWAQAAADRARIHTVLRAPPDWRAPATTSVPASTTKHGAPIIQPKLIVGEVNDPFEHEADRVADQVMRIPDRELSVGAAPMQLSRKCAACEADEQLLRKRSDVAEPAAAEAPSLAHEVVRSPGQSLDAATRAYFEPRFGQDFSRVRVHADAQAAAAADAVDALAYTAGQHLVFGAGTYAPNTEAGRRLLAHELTHSIQQSSRPAASADAATLQRSPTPEPKMPWYQQYQLEALEGKIQGWTDVEKNLARSLLQQWFTLRNAGDDTKTIYATLQEQVINLYIAWLVAVDQATQEYCSKHDLTVAEKFQGATCDPCLVGQGSAAKVRSSPCAPI